MTPPRQGLAGLAFIGAIWTFLAMATQSVFQIISLVILARLLSPNEFGIFVVSMAVLGFCGIFSQLGVGPAIVQRKVLEERHVRVGFTLSLLLSAIVAVLVWLAAPAFAGLFKMPELVTVLRAGCFVLAFQGTLTVALALAQRDLRFRFLSGVDAGAFGVGYVIVGSLLAWQGFGIWALVGAYLTQHFLRMTILLANQPHRKMPLFDIATARELLYFGAGFSLARIGNYLASQGDKLVVGRLLGAQALGVYGYAYQLMNATAVLIGKVLDRVLFPTMALVQLEPARLTRAYRNGVAACALIILPASIVLTLMTPEVVMVLLGPAWMGVVEPLAILALSMVFRSSYKISDSVARATGAVYARAWRQWVFAAAIVLGAYTGQHWGLAGVSVGVLSAIALNFFLMAHLSLKLTSLSWQAFGAAHLPALALAVVIGAETWFLVDWLRTPAVPAFLLLICVGFVTSVSTVLFWWSMPAVFLGADLKALIGSLLSTVFQRLQGRRASQKNSEEASGVHEQTVQDRTVQARIS